MFKIILFVFICGTLTFIQAEKVKKCGAGQQSQLYIKEESTESSEEQMSPKSRALEDDSSDDYGDIAARKQEAVGDKKSQAAEAKKMLLSLLQKDTTTKKGKDKKQRRSTEHLTSTTEPQTTPQPTETTPETSLTTMLPTTPSNEGKTEEGRKEGGKPERRWGDPAKNLTITTGTLKDTQTGCGAEHAAVTKMPEILDFKSGEGTTTLGDTTTDNKILESTLDDKPDGTIGNRILSILELGLPTEKSVKNSSVKVPDRYKESKKVCLHGKSKERSKTVPEIEESIMRRIKNRIFSTNDEGVQPQKNKSEKKPKGSPKGERSQNSLEIRELVKQLLKKVLLMESSGESSESSPTELPKVSSTGKDLKVSPRMLEEAEIDEPILEDPEYEVRSKELVHPPGVKTNKRVWVRQKRPGKAESSFEVDESEYPENEEAPGFPAPIERPSKKRTWPHKPRPPPHSSEDSEPEVDSVQIDDNVFEDPEYEAPNNLIGKNKRTWIHEPGKNQHKEKAPSGIPVGRRTYRPVGPSTQVSLSKHKVDKPFLEKWANDILSRSKRPTTSPKTPVANRLLEYPFYDMEDIVLLEDKDNSTQKPAENQKPTTDVPSGGNLDKSNQTSPSGGQESVLVGIPMNPFWRYFEQKKVAKTKVPRGQLGGRDKNFAPKPRKNSADRPKGAKIAKRFGGGPLNQPKISLDKNSFKYQAKPLGVPKVSYLVQPPAPPRQQLSSPNKGYPQYSSKRGDIAGDILAKLKKLVNEYRNQVERIPRTSSFNGHRKNSAMSVLPAQRMFSQKHSVYGHLNRKTPLGHLHGPSGYYQTPSGNQGLSDYYQRPSGYHQEPSNYHHRPSGHYQRPSAYHHGHYQGPSGNQRPSGHHHRPSNYRQGPSDYHRGSSGDYQGSSSQYHGPSGNQMGSGLPMANYNQRNSQPLYHPNF